jgi:predicted lipid-binding transport protein (Tim44 family)
MRAMLLTLAMIGCTTKANLGDMCTQAACPLGGHSYKFCNGAGATACRYTTSDGRTFNCASCSNCTAAANQVAAWCSMGTSTGGTTGTSTGGTTGGLTGGTTGGLTGGTTGTSTGGTTGTMNLNGCNGLLTCYINCNQSNPVQSCFDACDADSTQQAQDLLNNFGTCIDTNCFQAVNADSGTTFCDPSSSNPTAAPACSDCYNRILGAGGACAAAQAACANDKP